MKERGRYLVKASIAGVCFLFFAFLMKELLPDFLKDATFSGVESLRFLIRICGIIGEAGVAACIIGFLIEFSHFKRFYDALIRKALVDEEYLKKFKAHTLDDIISKSYYYKNENEITNKSHLWRDQFEFAWENLKELPVQEYRTNYVQILNHYFFSKKDLVKIPGKLSQKFKMDLRKLNTDILITEEIQEYDLISPYSHKEHDYVVSSPDMLHRFKDLPEGVETKDFLRYELEKNDKAVDLKIDTDYSIRTEEKFNNYELHYETKIGPRSHFLVKVYSVEPDITNFFATVFQDQIADAIEVYFNSNIDFLNLDYECWFPSEDGEKYKERDKTKRSIIFEYTTWVFPNSGYCIVWKK